MNKLYFITAVTLLMLMGPVITALSQAPEGFYYQAEARDSRGRLISNTALTVNASILEQSTSGSSVWEKSYSVRTDKFGLFSIIIGDVEHDDEEFVSIDWEDGKYFLSVQIIYGSSAIQMPVTQLISVPYALYAKSAGNVYETDPVFSGWNKSTGISINASQVSDFQTSVANNAAVAANTAKISYPPEDASKLGGIAAGAEVNVNADWNATEGDAQILNKPTLSNVAISGNYADLSGKPDLTIYATKNMADENITNLANPVNAQDAATKAYVDVLLARIEALEESDLLKNGFTDTRDGNHYNVVKIGNQVWMSENLAYLPSVNQVAEGSEDVAGSYYYVCGYNGTDVNAAKATANYTTYGVLYNWTAAMDGEASSSVNPSGVQGVCPTGWHLPSDTEWTELTDYLGGESVAGGKLKETGTTHWRSPNTGATNETGFTALPGGYRHSNGDFYGIGYHGDWWSSTENYFTSYAWYRRLACDYTYVRRDYYYKEYGFSVRCVRD